jgi:carboxyl-terminal processing protease
MTRTLGTKLLSLVLILGLLAVPAARAAAASAQPAVSPSEASASTNVHALRPGPEDGRVAYVAARLLEKLHYSHHRFDDTISSEFLDRYLEALDSRHMHFTQADLNQFGIYRTNLDNLTITRDGFANVRPAFAIFSRFVERLKQRVAYADELLARDKFEFNGDDKIVIDRHDAPYPEDLDAARKLWLQQLRYEYLQEKLGLEDPGKAKSEPAKEPAGKTVDQQVVDTLTRRYHRILRMYTDWNDEDVLGVYLTALAHVYDPHSDYFNHAQMTEFSMSMNLELFGIGAELTSEDGYCKIRRLLPGPAARSKKIKDGDRILAVAQGDQPPVDIVDMSLSKVVQLIRGPKGTEVRLTISPAADPSAREVVSLIRDEIPLDDRAAKGKIIDLPKSQGKTVRLGIIDLPSFYTAMDLDGPKPSDPDAPTHSTTADVVKLLNKFKQEHVQGVILDLRRNGGGSLEEAIKLTGLFIKDGPVVQVRASDGRLQVDRDTDPSIEYDGPLMVLTSRFSASASEIVAGALQDYGRALIVGDSSTHGKGTVQNLNFLKPFVESLDSEDYDPGALKITIRKFYRASGASTQLKGVMPDIVLPSVLNYWKDVGEKSLDNPLPWDTIPSVKYDKLNLVQPYLSELLKRSTERVATNQDFIYVRQDIAQYRKQQEDKTISLNEKQRLEEMEENEARLKARDKERLARKEPDEKVYEITLKQALLPGLPPPVEPTNSLALKSAGAVGGTNSTSVASTEPTSGTDLNDDPDDLKGPAVDVDLDEAKNIMLDYLSLLPKDDLLTTTR